MAVKLLDIINLTKRFSSGQAGSEEKLVLENINLTVDEGEFISIIGPSGCGKSTLLRIIGGLEAQYEGKVIFGGQEVHNPSRERGFIFQDHRLLPWLTVEENISFSLPDNAENKTGIIAKTLAVVGLTEAAKAYPNQLSGGMAQRVAVARALANYPKMLLLDEPFGALDAMTKMKLQDEMLKLWRREHITMAIVTHDIDEAVYLGGRVIVLDANPGRVRRIYNIEHPTARSRTSQEFHLQRDKIYREFFQEDRPCRLGDVSEHCKSSVLKGI